MKALPLTREEWIAERNRIVVSVVGCTCRHKTRCRGEYLQCRPAMDMRRAMLRDLGRVPRATSPLPQEKP